MPNKKEYLDFLMDWLSPLGEITQRPMMGGNTLYCDGVVFALVGRNALYLKADSVTRPRFESLGLVAFRPSPDNPGTMQFYEPPAEFFEDSDVMKDWGRAAVEVGRRAARKKSAGRKRDSSEVRHP
jgi:DNA transformation protein